MGGLCMGLDPPVSHPSIVRYSACSGRNAQTCGYIPSPRNDHRVNPLSGYQWLRKKDTPAIVVASTN